MRYHAGPTWESTMKLAVLFILLATPAFAQEKTFCVDASGDTNYNARPISLHDVLARNALGDKRSVRLGTSCIHVDRTARVALHSMTQCIGKGDEVATATIDGRREVCRVTSIAPGEDYATAKYKD
jgi:hypothetical protein